jgi:hypothetical protein
MRAHYLTRQNPCASMPSATLNFDSRTIRSLAGDDALTAVGQSVVDHWENGFGEGPYAGHAFSVGGQLTQEGDAPLRGEAQGHVD